MPRDDFPGQRQTVRTQAELAELVGFSRVTVSKALSNHPGVTERTRRIVAEAARKHGYRPNAAARAMRSGRLGYVGLVIRCGHDDYVLPPALLRSIHEELNQRDIHLVLADVARVAADDDAVAGDGDGRGMPGVFRELAADGLIIDVAEMGPAVAEHIVRWAMPVIWMRGEHEANCVQATDQAAMMDAVERLTALGHRRVGWLSFITRRHVAARRRRDGFSESMGRQGLEPLLCTPCETLETADARVAAVEQWMNQSPGPTAVIADSLAAFNSLMLLAARRGWRVPEDLSVLLVASRAPREWARPIHLLRYPWRAMGAAAVEMLLARAEHGDQPSRSIAYPPIEEGGTISPPPEGHG